MTRLVLAIVAAMALSGCQHSGQQAIDPFWGHTTVPPPPTGSIGTPIISPGCPQPLQAQPIIPPGAPLSTGGLPATTPPNLLPAPMSSMPATPGTFTPIPATPVPAGNAVPFGNGAPAMTSPPSGYRMPDRAPPSGYSNSGSPAPGLGSPAAATPGSGPAATYPASPSPPTSPTPPSGMAPPTSRPAPATPNSGSSPSPSPATTPAPAGSPPSNPPPDYFPEGGFNYHGSTQGSSGQDHWVTPGGVAAARPGVAGTPSLDGATVSAPPGTVLDAGPGIVRIPTGVDGGSVATSASAGIGSLPEK